MSIKPIMGLYRQFLQESIDKSYLSNYQNSKVLGCNFINNNYLVLIEYGYPEICINNLGENF